jgi:transposase
MPKASLDRTVLLPELRLLKVKASTMRGLLMWTEKTSEFEVCPRCALPSRSVYDRRSVLLRDQPLRGRQVLMWVRKRRFSCRHCRRPFTEPVPGVRKGYRTTQRYRKALLWACEHFSDLKRVRGCYRCSAGLLYRVLYEQLELKRRTRLYPWPTKVGIDEHFFKRDKYSDRRSFVTMVVDQKNRRVMEVVDGKETAVLNASLAYIPGRENVRWVALDLADSYRSFARSFFPNARLVADKFHVLRLVNPAINRYLREVVTTREAQPLRNMLRRDRRRLKPWWRSRLDRWLKQHPALHELYQLKEALSHFYRIRGLKRAQRVLTKLTDTMALSRLPEVQTLRRTLMRWRQEVLAYFVCRLTNARTEGYNAKAKLVKRRGYGYRSFVNYRLRLLSACC